MWLSREERAEEQKSTGVEGQLNRTVEEKKKKKKTGVEATPQKWRQRGNAPIRRLGPELCGPAVG